MPKKWIQGVVAKMKAKGTVGSFSSAAKKAGMSALAFAGKVTKKGSKSSLTMKRRALFVTNVSKSKH